MSGRGPPEQLALACRLPRIDIELGLDDTKAVFDSVELAELVQELGVLIQRLRVLLYCGLNSSNRQSDGLEKCVFRHRQGGYGLLNATSATSEPLGGRRAREEARQSREQSDLDG